MKKNVFTWFVFLAFFISINNSLYADEKITLSTYYPAPYGEYRTLSVGDTYAAPAAGGNTNLVVEGNVGIGTTMPDALLEVHAQADAQMVEVARFSNSLTSYIGTGTSISLGTESNGYLAQIGGVVTTPNTCDIVFRPFKYGSGNAENMRISGNGNIGIGTASPWYKLHVSCGTTPASPGSADSYRLASFESTVGTDIEYNVALLGDARMASISNIGVYGLAGGANGTTSEKYGVYGLAMNAGVNYGVYGTATGGTTNWAGYFAGGNVYVQGNVGIGTTNPADKLHVKTIDTSNVLRVENTYAADNITGIISSATSNSSNSKIAIYGAARGDSNSKAGVIGEASGTGDSNSGVRGVAYNTATRNYGVYGKTYGFVATDIAAGQSCGVYGAGVNYDFCAGGPGANYGSVSSIRWKENIKPIDNPLDKVSQLRGVYFDWDEEHGGHHDVGMVAEEVGKVLPEVVVYENDGEYATAMDYSKLTPLLIEAVKELKSENEKLEQRIAELEKLEKKQGGGSK